MTRVSPNFRPRRYVVAIGLCLALSACENPLMDEAPTLDEILAEGRLMGKKLDQALTKGWLFRNEETDVPLKRAPPLYCYETIGVSDCYEQPLEGGGNRLVGFDGPPPEDITSPPLTP